jgi:hypothetical protein
MARPSLGERVDDLDEHIRRLASENSALRFIVDFLFSEYLLHIENNESRLQCLKDLVRQGGQMDHLVGLSKDGHAQEWMADVIVGMHEQLDAFAQRMKDSLS